MRIVLQACSLVIGIAIGGAANAADEAAAQRARDVAMMIDVYVDGCIRIDQTLREACGDSPARVPAPYRAVCTLPARSFKARIGDSYAAWRALHAAELEAQAEKIAATKAKSASGFDRQFAPLREGILDRANMDFLSRELTESCAVVENEWLRPKG